LAYGSHSSYGLGITSTGSLVSEGLPANLNWIVRYNTVQEQSASPWTSSTVGSSVKVYSGTPDVTATYTGWSVPAVASGFGNHFHNGIGGSASFTHCQFSSGSFTVDPGSVDLNNCLWQRVSVTLRDMEGDPVWSLYNNLFYGGTFYYRATGDNPTLLAYDNVFDRTTVTRGISGKYFTHDYNGYITGQSRLTPSPAPNDVPPLANMVYAPGPMGLWYHGDTALTDQGSRSAEAAGLAVHTTRPDETPDTGDVDIGFHYPLVACNLLPLGFTINLETTVQGYLQIKPTAQTTPLPFVNVASSGRGTVARISVAPNPDPEDPSTWSKIVGEYYTIPDGGEPGPRPNGDPSRTTVDRYGNVWVGNRAIFGDEDESFGSVTKFGVVIGGTRGKKIGGVFVPDPEPLPPGQLPGEYLQPPFVYNTCVDRDGDGLIHSSYGLDSRLAWTDQALPPGDGDEAIIYYVRTTPTYVRSLVVDRDNNLWVGSKYDGWQELIDNATGAPVTGQKFMYGLGGYGAVFDPYGVLWSAGYNEASWPAFEGLLWRPPGNGVNVVPGTTGGLLPGTQYAYGIGIDPTTADVWLGDFKYGGLWQFKQGGCTNKFGFAAPENPSGKEIKGIVVDSTGDVWVAHAKFEPYPPDDEEDPPGKAVYRFSNTGEYRGRVVLEHPSPPPPFTNVVGKSPHGVCLDSQQRVWAICFRPAEDGQYYAMRIDPNQNPPGDPPSPVVGRVVEAVALGTFPAFDVVYHGPYNYSDMSGFVTLAATQPAGVWDYVEDLGSNDMRWLWITQPTEFRRSVCRGAGSQQCYGLASVLLPPA
jgi:hypothetical protein